MSSGAWRRAAWTAGLAAGALIAVAGCGGTSNNPADAARSTSAAAPTGSAGPAESAESPKSPESATPTSPTGPAGSATAGTDSPTAPARSHPASDRVTPLPTHGGVDYQLGGAYPPPAGVTVVVRDAGAQPAPHTYSVCYVNGFQTQPDQAALWSGRRADLLLHGSDGRPVSDPDWPGEHILDPTTAAKRARILAVLAPVIRSCAAKGFQGVEIDNLDTFTRFRRIPESATAALARSYVRTAHHAGLAVAQKNAAESSRTARSWGFDFAVAEECHVYDECGQYTAVYGKRVIEVEYTDNLRTPFAQLCRAADRVPLLVLRDRDLTTPGSAGYARRAC